MKLLGIELVKSDDYPISYRLNTIYEELNDKFIIEICDNTFYIYREQPFFIQSVIDSDNELAILKTLYSNLKKNNDIIELKQFEEVFAKVLLFL